MPTTRSEAAMTASAVESRVTASIYVLTRSVPGCVSGEIATEGRAALWGGPPLASAGLLEKRDELLRIVGDLREFLPRGLLREVDPRVVLRLRQRPHLVAGLLERLDH